MVWVDLDNPCMVDRATDFILDDVEQAVKYDQVQSYIEVDGSPDLSLTEGDIHSFIIEDCDPEVDEEDE